MKTPTPDPSVVCESVITGLALVFQQTPLATTVAVPCEVTFPPELAVVPVIEVIAVVVTVGATANVVKLISLP